MVVLQQVFEITTRSHLASRNVLEDSSKQSCGKWDLMENFVNTYPAGSRQFPSVSQELVLKRGNWSAC
ncbi:hypothetical protein TNCV_599851 [Trichonephila clavipes]|nr:hypothetical protein TNCV_599851 [Trichonephila clavipes]